MKHLTLAHGSKLEPLPRDVFAGIVDAMVCALVKEMRAELRGMVGSPSGIDERASSLELRDVETQADGRSGVVLFPLSIGRSNV